MDQSHLIGLSAIVGVGLAAQWVAWRLAIPSILLLLLAGLFVGPVAGLIDPHHVFGDLMHPIISLAVAVILFEGGLSLRFDDLREVGRPVRNLITIGAAVTWVLASLGGVLVVGLEPRLAILLGAVLVVTGPTVIVPMLAHLRPRGRIAAAARWEGIVNDPIGAMLAVLVYEVIRHPGIADATAHTAEVITLTAVVGTAIGLLGGVFLTQALKRYWIPDYLRNPIVLGLVLAVSTLANQVQEESGLLSVTVMGIVLANQSATNVHRIIEFKEDLQVLLISSLFVMLAADLSVETLQLIDGRALLFLALLIFVIRPLAVLASAWGTDMTVKEMLFLMWMAPRGIVAAAVASVFALKLTAAGFEGADRLVPVTFTVIAGTVAFYGLTAGPVMRRIGLLEEQANGVVLVGATPWVRALASRLDELGVPTLLVDTNHANVLMARMKGLDAMEANVLTDPGLGELDLTNMGRALSLTSNDEVNSLASVNFERMFGRADVYRLPSTLEDGADEAPGTGRILFGTGGRYDEIAERFATGHRIVSHLITADCDEGRLREQWGDDVLALAYIDADGTATPQTADAPIQFTGGGHLVLLVDAEHAAALSAEARRTADVEAVDA